MHTYTLAIDGLGTMNISTSERDACVRLAKELRAQRIGYILVNHAEADLVGYFEEDEMDAPQFLGTEYDA